MRTVLFLVSVLVLSTRALRVPSPVMQFGGQLVPGNKQGKGKLLVIGGNGFVGRQVCKYAVQAGFSVTSLSRRGECPSPEDEFLSQVTWEAGNALDKQTVERHVGQADAVVHAIGLLFDVNSGLDALNAFTSASKSKPDPEQSTYDNITRKTALLVIQALRSKAALSSLLGGSRTPIAFVSCAEAGWPDVAFGPQVERASPDWLKRYLVAKRAVESELVASSKQLRPIVVRPSLIWDWGKLDVLPVIPVFNLASAIGIPFVDKTVRVEDVGRSIVAGLLDESVSGVQRFGEMERLSEGLAIPR
jgi:nucleoside-diphosphate-sugar epimerase